MSNHCCHGDCCGAPVSRSLYHFREEISLAFVEIHQLEILKSHLLWKAHLCSEISEEGKKNQQESPELVWEFNIVLLTARKKEKSDVGESQKNSY